VAAAPRRISLLVWVALALVPVVIVAVIWAAMILGKSGEPNAGPLPAVSTH
jgi:hypothetical protein